jgi:hypothetical protein
MTSRGLQVECFGFKKQIWERKKKKKEICHCQYFRLFYFILGNFLKLQVFGDLD